MKDKLYAMIDSLVQGDPEGATLSWKEYITPKTRQLVLPEPFNDDDDSTNKQDE